MVPELSDARRGPRGREDASLTPLPEPEIGHTAPDSYHVLALRVRRAADDDIEHRLDLLLTELRTRCGTGILPVFGAHGGTLLVPANVTSSAALDPLLTAAAAAAGLRLVVAVVRADLADIPVAYDHAHELLRLADLLGRGDGVYRFDDLALEYQLTRPGHARDLLAATIAPLRAELTASLTQYLRHNGDLAATARAMRMPRGALAAHLDDIARLTGLEPRRPTDLWRLYAAMVAGAPGAPDDRAAAETSHHAPARTAAIHAG
ncbi:PucR family transcriptional regulator [Nocardia arizonensis]|uniref:PucR family transcriptional regulator n=1 Tax=Nocardia arizonensis TaxID=1141647 RepID=UPI0006D02A32|nr:helix-turn-helix domain-containing protein [Nocardia arizonensis]